MAEMAGDRRAPGAAPVPGDSVEYPRSGLGLERVSRADLERAYVALAGECLRAWRAELAAMSERQR